MVKIVIIGAGSAVFSKNVIADILWHEALADSELVLVDIDPERLDTALALAKSINATLGARARISATRHRRRALAGANFVICTIGVGGVKATIDDIMTPLKFGVKQTVGDTIGVGGVFRAVRSVPEVLAICADMEELCPGALLLNYTNPMAMHCLAIFRASKVRAVGLCHGVQNTAQTMRMIVELMKHPKEEVIRHFRRPWDSPKRVEEWQRWMAEGKDPHLSYTCAGINHMAFFLRFESAGRDIYPYLWKALEIPHMLRLDPVRFELFRRLGYFMTETSGHMAEYVPYFLKSPREISQRHLRVSSYVGTCKELDAAYRQLRRTVKSGRQIVQVPYEPSNEHASRIINAAVTDRPFIFNGNVHNRGGALISNLPGDSCVEVPCVSGRAGIQPVSIGELPPQCAALIRTNINVQDLAVRGILEGKREYIYQAVMMDPNTASVLTLPEIWKLCDTMFEVHHKRLPVNLR